MQAEEEGSARGQQDQTMGPQPGVRSVSASSGPGHTFLVHGSYRLVPDAHTVPFIIQLRVCVGLAFHE